MLSCHGEGGLSPPYVSFAGREADLRTGHPSKAACDEKQERHQDDEPEARARPIAPVPAVRPSRKSCREQQNGNDQK